MQQYREAAGGVSNVLETRPEFFVVGGSLRRDAGCYIERPADAELYDAALRGEFCYVLTSRQMGKSSLMIRTAYRLREAGIAVAILDLTAVGLNVTPEQWYSGLLTLTGHQLDLEEELETFWYSNERTPPMLRFFQGLREVVLQRVRGPVVLFVDEVDAVRSLPFSADEFFAGIRECHNRRMHSSEGGSLTFGLFGVASPSDLIQDPHVTPFNIGRRIELNDFSFADALKLAERLGADGTNKLKRIFQWTEGHPFLTLKLCRVLAMEVNATVNSVDKYVHSLFFTVQAQETEDNLIFVRRYLLKAPEDIAGVLDLYQRVRSGKAVYSDEANPYIPVLRLSGVVRVDNRKLHVRNPIYSRVFGQAWIQEHMPDAELRRQRAAYRRGVVRASLSAGALVATLSLLTGYAFQQKSRADQATTEIEYVAQRMSLLSTRYEKLITLVAANGGSRMQSDVFTPEFQKQLLLDVEEISQLQARLRQLTGPSVAPGPVPPTAPATLRPTPKALVPRAEITPSATFPSPPAPVRLPTAPPAANESTPSPTPSPVETPTPSPTETPTPSPSPTPQPEPTSVEAATASPTPTPLPRPRAGTISDEEEYASYEARSSTPVRVTFKPVFDPPETLRRTGFRGSVECLVTVAATGTTTVKLVRGTGDPEYDRYMVEFFKKWRYDPAKLDGKAIRTSRLERYRIY